MRRGWSDLSQVSPKDPLFQIKKEQDWCLEPGERDQLHLFLSHSIALLTLSSYLLKAVLPKYPLNGGNMYLSQTSWEYIYGGHIWPQRAGVSELCSIACKALETRWQMMPVQYWQSPIMGALCVSNLSEAGGVGLKFLIQLSTYMLPPRSPSLFSLATSSHHNLCSHLLLSPTERLRTCRHSPLQHQNFPIVQVQSLLPPSQHQQSPPP